MTSRKRFREIRKQIEENPTFSVDYHQLRPYTIAVGSVILNDVSVTGFGVSKVRWPDQWDYTRGYQVARGKLLDTMVKVYLGEEKVYSKREAEVEELLGIPLEEWTPRLEFVGAALVE